MQIFLADDDTDDCIFFKEALEDIRIHANLTTINDGVQLMELLTEKELLLPDVLYLDLNMPRKNGFECLSEIKLNGKLKNLPVIIFSTSLDPHVVNLLQQGGANYYIRKPAEFFNLKKVIHKSLKLILENKIPTAKENFVINPS